MSTHLFMETYESWIEQGLSSWGLSIGLSPQLPPD